MPSEARLALRAPARARGGEGPGSPRRGGGKVEGRGRASGAPRLVPGPEGGGGGRAGWRKVPPPAPLPARLFRAFPPGADGGESASLQPFWKKESMAQRALECGSRDSGLLLGVLIGSS